MLDLDRDDTDRLIRETGRMMEQWPDAGRRTRADGRTLGYVFYEPSTRTRLSFCAAMQALGGQTLGTSNMADSSASKGESLHDTMRMVSIYADVIALRHPDAGAARLAADATDTPVINAGDGDGEHPTQGIQDIFTICKEKGGVDGLTIGVAGDLLYGRAAHSLLYGLAKYDGVRVVLASPECLRPPAPCRRVLDNNIDVRETRDIAEHMGDLDVLYATRVQRERFAGRDAYEQAKKGYRIRLEDVKKHMKDDAIIMHPLPRTPDEMDAGIDHTPQSRYFKQAEYGLYARAAILMSALGS